MTGSDHRYGVPIYRAVCGRINAQEYSDNRIPIRMSLTQEDPRRNELCIHGVSAHWPTVGWNGGFDICKRNRAWIAIVGLYIEHTPLIRDEIGRKSSLTDFFCDCHSLLYDIPYLHLLIFILSYPSRSRLFYRSPYGPRELHHWAEISWQRAPTTSHRQSTPSRLLLLLVSSTCPFH